MVLWIPGPRLGDHDAGVMSSLCALGATMRECCPSLGHPRWWFAKHCCRSVHVDLENWLGVSPRGPIPNDVSHETELSWMFTMLIFFYFFSGLRPHQRAIRDFAPRDHAGAKEAAGAEVPARVRLPEPKSQRLQAVTLLAKSRTHRSIFAWLPKPLQQHDGLRGNGSLLC